MIYLHTPFHKGHPLSLTQVRKYLISLPSTYFSGMTGDFILPVHLSIKYNGKSAKVYIFELKGKGSENSYLEDFLDECSKYLGLLQELR